MAETTKLSVGEALNKLRGTDVPASKLARLDEKINALDEETRRLRATRLGVELSQRVGSATRDAKEANKSEADQGRTTRLKISGMMIGIAVAILVLGWACWLLWR